jgi:hypothetical protein
MLGLVSLFFFTMATGGFVLFMVKYPHGSDIRTWGIRLSYALGFFGVLAWRVHRGAFSEISLLTVSALLVSLVAFELSTKYLD